MNSIATNVRTNRMRALLLKFCLASSLAFKGLACAQDWQFGFDSAGNDLFQTSESPADPIILGQPQMQIVIPGELASFSVAVADTRGVRYR